MLQKSSMMRTAAVFFTYPTKPHYLMDISRILKIAHTSIKMNLSELLREGIIIQTKEKRGTRTFPLYRANRDHILFKKYKKAYNLSSVLESGLVEFIEEKFAPQSIVLFGSHSRGEDTEESDIDLFVGCKKDNLDLSFLEKKLARKIELHFNENFPSYPKELKNNIVNGIVLSGFLEAFP